MLVPLVQFLMIVRFSAIGEGGAPAEIQVYNRVGLTQAIFERAVDQAQKIFDKAGVPTKWMLCPANRDAPQETRCPINESAFLLGVVKEDRMLIAQRDTMTIGYTLRTSGRNNAAVIWPRVQNFAIWLGINSDLLLAYAMAHEIGHLLSPIGHHSIGVMEPAWDREDAMNMARGRLGFCDRDAEHMRSYVDRMAKNGGANRQIEVDSSAIQPRATY